MLSLFAAGHGAAAGLLVPRPAYRLAVPAEEPWRTACPAGHPINGPGRGWIGPARCTPCAARGAAAAPLAPADPGSRDADGPGPDVPVRPCPARPGGRYGPRTVPVALVTAAACAVIAVATGPRPELAVWLLLTPVAVVLALVDRAVHRLPDVLTLPLAVATAVLLGLADLLPGNAGSWPGALLGGAALAAVYFLLFVINPSGMGFGDVKLALALGLALGWYGRTVLITGAFAGFLIGALYGLGLMLLRRAGRKTAMPFGPFMIFGAFLGVLLGAPGPL